jgi:hypothetical protein
MSFKATIEVGGQKVNLLECDYELKQEIDATGRPSSVTRGGQITLLLESSGDTFFFEWMCNNFERKDGTVTFFKRDTDAKLKELKFKEGYLVFYEEHFDSVTNTPMTEKITISARELTCGNGTLNNEWRSQ